VIETSLAVKPIGKRRKFDLMVISNVSPSGNMHVGDHAGINPLAVTTPPVALFTLFLPAVYTYLAGATAKVEEPHGLTQPAE
jgi:hypothetical protein